MNAWVWGLSGALWLIIILLLRRRPLHMIDYAAVVIWGLVLVRSISDLVSMDGSGVTALDRLWARRFAGGEIGDWWALVLGSVVSIVCWLFKEDSWGWIPVAGFALLALVGAWRLVRPPVAPAPLPPLTRATWPDSRDDEAPVRE